LKGKGIFIEVYKVLITDNKDETKELHMLLHSSTPRHMATKYYENKVFEVGKICFKLNSKCRELANSLRAESKLLERSIQPRP
jgi:hypothetical protein